MSYQSFLVKFTILTAIFLFIIGGINFYIDPLWMFSHRNELNDFQKDFNERQQKTNLIAFSRFDYDGLLLGSSRVTYMDQHDFKKMRVFNYSVSNMSVQEYSSIIEYAKQKNKKDFKAIYIGVDFFKSSINQSNTPLTIAPYVNTTEEPFYRIKNLLSFSTFRYSIHNAKASYLNEISDLRNYNRENTANAPEMSLEIKQKQTEEKVIKFRNEFYGKSYEYNQNYKNIFMELKQNNPNTTFIIFTTPISAHLFQALVDEGRLIDYERWLTDLVDVFGGVFNFMYPNSVTSNLNNYFDGHHFYPHIGTNIINRMTNPNDPDLPTDFGVWVTQENLNSHLQYVRKVVEANPKSK